MPKYKEHCPKNNEIDLYTGCSFGCVYCIAAVRHSHPAFQTGDIQEIKHKICSLADNGFPFYLSPWTDAYQSLEDETRLAGEVVRMLASKDISFFVVTKGTGVLRDVHNFRQHDNAFIAVSLNTLDSTISERLEPGAPSATARQELVENLLGLGDVRTVVKIDPILPAVTDGSRLDKLLGWLERVQPDAVTVETARLDSATSKGVKDALMAREYSELISHYPKIDAEPCHPRMDYRISLFRDIAQRLSAKGINASFCKASLPMSITPFDCRGGFIT
jgi:DNA repair photolyase